MPVGPAIHVKSIDGATAVADGTPVDTRGGRPVVLTTNSTGVTSGATIIIQVSPDGTNWGASGTSITADADGVKVAAMDFTARFVRARVDAYTDGTHSAWITVGATGTGWV